jgi:hypothetical protein
MSIRINAIAVALVVALAATSPLQAGGFAEPLMEPEVVIAETAAASAPGGIIVPLILLALIAAVGLANGGGSTPIPVPPIGPA